MEQSTQQIRKIAFKVMRCLKSEGYEAFLVGGCVRDQLLDRQPKDFDVTTNALPEQVQAIFEHTIPVGAKFGVTVVVMDEIQIEVATYRSDGIYSDGRRPDTVTYGKTVQEDVERRDFTVNGLLMDVSGKIIDYAQGLDDIRNKVVRAIGDPNKRFEEDALRILRAVRFAAQLNFDIEKTTLEAFEGNAPLLRKISAERVAMELFKIFASPYPLKGIIPFLTTGLYRYCLPEEFVSTANMIYILQRFTMFEAKKNDPTSGMAMFFSDINSQAAERLANYLKLSTDQKQTLNGMNSLLFTFRRILSGELLLSEAELKRACRCAGLDYALDIMPEDELIGKTNFGVDAVMSFVLKIKAYKSTDLFPIPLITGQDLIAKGITPGPIFRDILYYVETMQLNGIFANRERALEFVHENVHQDSQGAWIYELVTAAGEPDAV